MIQLGARNMQNFDLLREVGRTGQAGAAEARHVRDDRGVAAVGRVHRRARATPDIVLCERGIRTFETAYRSTLDISAVPVVKALSSLPVIVDPSHAAGKRDLILPMARAAVVAGADGLIVEVHPAPETPCATARRPSTPRPSARGWPTCAAASTSWARCWPRRDAPVAVA